MMRHLCVASLCLTFCIASRDAAAASISGKITPADKVAKVTAVNRSKKGLAGGGKVYSKRTVFASWPAKFDGKTGAFKIDDVPNGRYDLIIELMDGGRIEGFHCRLERDFRRDKPLDEKTRKKFEKDFDGLTKVPAFCNVIRLIGYDGNGEFISALVGKARTRNFHSEKNQGEAIWRIERWVMINYTGSWKHHQLGNVVWYRKRIPAAEFSKMTWVFDPKLGGIRIHKGASVKGFQYQIPEKLETLPGKVGDLLFGEPLKYTTAP